MWNFQRACVACPGAWIMHTLSFQIAPEMYFARAARPDYRPDICYHAIGAWYGPLHPV
jgi:hypothetical protein